MSNLSLFDPPHNGTATSKAAARQIKVVAGTQRAEILRAIVEAGSEGLTDKEIQDALGMGGDTERPRRGELLKGGYVRESGELRETANNRKGIVWVATRKGMEVAA